MMDGRSFEAVPKELKESKQWCLWRYESTGDSEKASKIPYQVNGRRAKSDDPTTWNTFDNCLAAYRKNQGEYDGIEFLFSEQQSLVGIDFDNGLDENREPLPWCAELLKIIRQVAYIETSPSGRGMKAWLNTGHWREIKQNRFDFNVGAEQRIEVYSWKRPFTVTGDAWVPGIEGPLPDAGDVFNTFMDRLAELCPTAPTARKPATVAMVHHAGGDDPSQWPPIEERIERARLYLERCPAAISGQGGHNQTMAVAGAVAVGFALSEDQAFQVMQDWNARCLPPWSEHDLRRKISEAQKTSQKPTGHLLDGRGQFDDPPDVDISGFLPKRSAPSQQHGGSGDSQGQAVDQSDAQPSLPLEGHPALQAIRERIVRIRDGLLGWDAHGAYLKHQRQQSIEEPTQLPEPPEGFLRDFTQHIVAGAHRSQPAFAQMAAVCTLGTLIGRKVQTLWRLQANLYVLCLGTTSTGKEHPRDESTALLDAAARGGHLLAEDQASSTALLRGLATRPSGLWMANEFNKTLEAINSKQSGTHLALIRSLLLKLWTGPQSKQSELLAFADVKFNVEIDRPHLTIFATGTPDGMFENLSTSDVKDGLIGRMMFVFGRKNDETIELDFSKQKPEIPPQVIDFAKAWVSPRPGTNDIRHVTGANPHTVAQTEEAAALLKVFYGEAQDRMGMDDIEDGVWGRAFEKVWKLALIAACSRYEVFQEGGGINFDAIRIREEDVAWATEVVRTITEGMVRAITGKVGETERERNLLKVERFIKSGKKNGVTRSDLLRHMKKLDCNDCDKLIKGLLSTHQIKVESRQGIKGRPPVVYTHLDFMPEEVE